MHSAARRSALVLCVVALLPWAIHGLEPAPRSAFAAEVERLSEHEGTFDTDNLISNERSYLDVIPALISSGVGGGAYIGVGPDQNFSYIARIRPSVAYIIDVRRDNLLLHLLFKAIFAHARNRAEYLSLLTGRSAPAPRARWSTATIDAIVKYVDSSAPAVPIDGLRLPLEQTIQTFGVPLTRADLDTIGRFHRAFIEAGLALQFHSHGRPASFYYPTLRELLLATDANGHEWNFLASEEDFQFVRTLEAHDGVIPVVGNVNGTHALRSIGRAIAGRGERVAAFYISNVENYLHRDGTYHQFMENLGQLPHDHRSLMIRSIFGGGGGSTSVVEAMNDTLARTGGWAR
jgi:hypothetical protein